jgi:sporulation protein YlmC with PRC-barrel domain
MKEMVVATVDNPDDTSGRLIAASNVSGTSVYNSAGEKLGSVYDVMLEKVSGKAEYAILSFGGFLGIGEKYHPLPWSVLTYDVRLGGYVVNLDRAKLEGAPAYSADELRTWDSSWDQGLSDYYGRPAV